MKRGELLVIFLVVVLLIFPMISAINFTDFWKDFKARITGEAVSGTAALNITIGNAAPTIPFVEVITPKTPTEGTNTSITFNFTARDTDGFGNLNDSTAASYFQKTGEATRSNLTCAPAGTSGANDKNYTCSINMWYFDGNGAWTINATIKDNAASSAENSTTTFTFNLLNAMVISPPALTWPAVGLSSVNIEANQNITVNNTGNEIDLTINVTAKDLRGETTTNQFIYSNNFTVNNATFNPCAATEMANGTSINVTNATLQKGNNSLNYWNATSGQEQTVYCLQGVVSNISAQSYSTSFLGAWTITTIT